MDDNNRINIEAAAFRALVKHLQYRKDLQNIDLMNLAGFCRNCLAKWFKLASEQYSDPVDYDEARDIIYGMSHKEWKEKYQKETSREQMEKFKNSQAQHAKIEL